MEESAESPNPEAVEAPIFMVPEGDPPALTPRAVSRRSSDGGLSMSSCPHSSFGEILGQIQALQERLRDIYEQDVHGDKLRPNQSKQPVKQKVSSKQLTVKDAHKAPSVNLPEDEDKKSAKAQTAMAQKARRTTTDFEDMLRTSDLKFHIGVEWDISDEGLCDLQKNHLAVSPRSGTAQTHSSIHFKKLRPATDRSPDGWAIYPESRIRILWDCLAMLALFLEVVTAPLQVYDIAGGFRQVFDVLHWVTTSYWFLDVPASFFTAVYINDILHTRLQDVARVYLKSWFCFDILMLAPEVLFFVNILSQPDDAESDPAASGLLRAMRARRLVRVIRFARIMRFRKAMTLMKKRSCYKSLRMAFQGWISASLLPIAMLLLCLVISIHFLASLWFVAGDVEQGWVQAEGLHEQPFMQQYIRSVEWSLSRLPASSLKYNVELGTSFERWLAIMATFVSLCISSLFISVLTNIMAGVARRTRKMTLILESVRKYCASSGVSLTHTMKIRRLVEREHFRANLQDHMQFLLSLPESLVRELFHEARSLTLNCHPFFLEIGLANATMELNLCNQAVKELYLLENDCMFHANQKGQGLYILASGAAIYAPGSEFHHPNPIEIASSPVQAPSSGRRDSFSKVLNIFGSPGDGAVVQKTTTVDSHAKPEVHIAAEDFVSEQALWIRGWKHQGRLEATVESRALLLSKEELKVVLQDYVEILATTVVYARSFLLEINKMPSSEISDMPLNPASLHLDPTKSASIKSAKKYQQSQRFDKIQPGE